MTSDVTEIRQELSSLVCALWNLAALCQLISTAEEQSYGQLQGVVSELSDWLSFLANQASALVERIEDLIDPVAASSPEGAS